MLYHLVIPQEGPFLVSEQSASELALTYSQLVTVPKSCAALLKYALGSLSPDLGGRMNGKHWPPGSRSWNT